MSEDFSLIIATHLALCPMCRREVATMEEIGGALVETSDAPASAAQGFDALMARLADEPRDAPLVTAPVPAPPSLSRFPRPLRDRLSAFGDELPWSRRGSVETVFLPASEDDHKVRLFRIAPGQGVPQHSHHGSELTLVLDGGFSDATGHYLRGDLQLADGELDHRPVADEGGPCICLAVTSAPLRLTGPLGRLINPFVRI
ncbi:MAG: cupin domain-containing protein [Rhodospirillales bacterium]|nr:cupin domain-containing protein [Rhodospirillales bacterium]